MGIIAWIVLGLLAGAIAKAVMPGDDPGGILVTMVIGVWLVWPVRDDWSGSHELASVAPVVPPERLAPATAPIEPRDR